MEFDFIKKDLASFPSKGAIEVLVAGSFYENMMKQRRVSTLKDMSKTTSELLTLVGKLSPART